MKLAVRCRRHFAVAGLFLLASGCSDDRPWNVLLVTFDTTRADYIGVYGREDATTPTLDAMATTGVLFERARTSNPITQPAHSTILTGVYPLMHGVRDNGMFRMPDELDTLAELLKQRGYATAAAIGGFPLTRDFGADQGFDFYDDDLQATRQDHRGRPALRQLGTWYDERPARHVNDAILGWLRTRPDRPFFIWMHYWDPHEPHIAPAPFSQLHAHDPYQGEIAYADDALGAMLRKLDELGELDRTLVIMTSDHGEGRGEHNEATHAFLAHETTLHVPLIMQVPGLGAGRRVVENVGTVDIVPTVLDYLGFEIPERVQGRSLVALINQEPGYQLLADEPYYAESMSPRLSHGFGDLRVLYDREQKLIYGPRPELYDLSVDPHELREISGQRPDQMSALKDRLEVVIDRYAGELSARQEFDEERLQRLAGLGYLNMTGGDVSVIEELRDDGGAPQDHVENINRVFQLRGLMGSGSFRLAALLAEELLANDPDNGYVQAQLALAHVGLGDTEAAVKVVRGSLPASAANINAFAHAAVAWAKAGETEAAAQLMHELLAGQNSAPALMALAQIQALDGNVGGRIESLSQAVHLKPDDRNSRLQLAFALLDEGRLTDAEGHLTTLVERAPGDARAHFGLSRVYWGSDLPERALERISRAVLLDPADCEALKSRIEWLVALGHDDEAASAQAGLPHACQDHQAGLP